MPKRKMNLDRWLYNQDAKVISRFTSRGKLICEASVRVPINPYAFRVQTMKVPNVNQGWAELEEIALAWADENNVEFFGSVL